MTDKGRLYGEEFPWFHVKRVTFNKKERSAIFEFRSENSQHLKATPPTEEKWDEMLRGAAVNLDNDQVVYQ